MSELDELEKLKPEGSPDDEETSIGRVLARYWRLLRKYYWVILLAAAATVGLTYVWTSNQPKIYAASSKIIFHQGNENVLGKKIDQVQLLDPGNRWQFEQFWNSQKEVFASRWFAERVVKREGLATNQAFLPDPPKGESLSQSEKREAAIDKVLGVSSVSLTGESRVAVIEVQMTDPELAKTVANGVAEAYVEYTKEFQSGGMENITNWFDSHVKKKRQELETAQSKLHEFKKENNILSFSYEDRQNLTASNMTSVNDELVKTKQELSAKRARLEQINKMTASEEEFLAVAELVDNDNLKETLQRKAELEEELAGLETKYLPEHPKVQAASSELETIQKNVDAQIRDIRTSLENRVEILERKKQDLESQLSSHKEELFHLNELGVQYKQLQNRTENLRNVYDTVLERSSELDINSLYDSNNIRVLEQARTPETPVSPNLPINLAIGLVLGLGLGTGTVFLIDALDTTIRREEDITRYTDKPVLAMLPRLNKSVLEGVEVIGESAADTITHTAPKSSFAEAIKTLRTNLTFMAPDKPPSSLLITSPGPQEGKTVTSANLAIAMAQGGQKTLLVDTDLRRPRIHKALGLDKERGLSTAVTQSNEPVGDLIQESVIDNLSVLTAGEVPPNPSELLHSESFETIHEQLQEDFDRVIYDSPPLAAVSDALILSQLVDGALLITQFGSTRRETLRRGLEQLHGIGAPLLGAVINDMAPQGPGYGYDYSYYRYYQYDEDTPGTSSQDHELAS
jgi:capsular exopolysaccharide synthesis family protein